MPPRARHAIGIVGGGISGLALHHYLRRRGADSVVLEAAAEPGGVIRSRRVDGRLLELGPQRTRLLPPLEALLKEVGLGESVIRAAPGLPLYVCRDGRLRKVPLTPREYVTADLLSPVGKLRLLCEPLTAPARPEETVGECLRRKFGGEAYRSFLGPLYGGIYASDPDRMLVRHSLAELLSALGAGRSLLWTFLRRWRGKYEGAPAISFREGMQALPDALFRAHWNRVRLQSPVKGIRAVKGGWTLETGGQEVVVETVVLTVPADVAASLLQTEAPDPAQRLARLTYNPVALVHLHSRGALRGYGYQVAFGEELATRGVTWNASLFGQEGVYTAYLGGARDPDAVLRSDAELGETAAREFHAVTGCPARTLAVTRTRIPAYDLSWRSLEGLKLPPGLRLCAGYLSRPGIPGRLLRARRLADELAEGGGRAAQ